MSNNLGHQLEVGPLLGSGVLIYRTPVPSAQTDSIGLRSQYTETVHPKTLKNIQGWKWDERIWTGYEYENYAAQLPCNWDPTVSGIPETYFQSGIGSHQDLELLTVKPITSSGLNQTGINHIWAPEINHGYYYHYNEQNYLFSDDSEVINISYSGIVEGLGTSVADGLNMIELTTRPKIGVPVLVEQYEWDNVNGQYRVARSVARKPVLTGRLVDGERLETYNALREEILWDHIDQTLDEFVITFSGEDIKLVLNKQYVEEVGTSGNNLEVLGYTDGRDNQQFHTQYAPIDDTMGIEIYSYMTSSGTWTTWTPIDFTDTISSGLLDFEVKLDTDLGILEFGVREENNIPLAGETIVAKYWKGMKVEYEPDYTTNTITATEASLNPIYRRSGKGFVILSTSTEDPASIELEALLTQIQEDIYGPLYIGNNTATLVATVRDVNGQPLEGQSVTFFLTTSPVVGSFSGEESIIAPTDQIGEARVFYNPPRGIGDIGENVTYNDVSDPVDNPSGYNCSQIVTVHTSNLVIEGDLNELFIYQVHIDDPLLGYLGDLNSPYDAVKQLQAYYTEFFTNEDIHGLIGLENLDNAIVWEETHRMLWELSRPLVFQNNAGWGRRRLCTTLDANALNPHTFEPGALVPFQPIDIRNTDIGEYDIVFDTSTYTLPRPTASHPTTPTGTLYAYFVVAPSTVTLQASVFNPRLNQVILSNPITLQLRIPTYLSGSWLLDTINESYDQVWGFLEAVAAGLTASGQQVPLGFRLRSNGVTLAGALDGVTFLDVNPESNLVVGHQINVIVSED